MNTLIRKLNTWKQWAGLPAIAAILILAYACLLAVKIPFNVSIFFTRYSIPLFFLTWLLFGLSLRLAGWKGWLAGLGLALVFFALPLSYKWTSAVSDNRVIAGLLPYKDQFSYYNGARELVNGGWIQADMSQASWRPLFPSLMASLLSLTGHDLKWSLAILTLITGMCFYLAGRQMRKISGPWAAGLFMALLFLYTNRYIGLFATELAGFGIACLGFSLLLSAAETPRPSPWLFGIGLLMLGICIRAGAFFIFPMLVIWSGRAFRNEKKYSFKAAGVSLLVVILSFFTFTWLAGKLLVASGSLPFGNLAYTLYGQAMGGAGWGRALQDVGPDPRLVLLKTVEMVRAHPMSLLIGVGKSYREAFFTLGSSILLPIRTDSQPVWANITLWSTCALLLLWGWIRSIQQWRNPIASFFLCGLIGVALSVPFLPPVDGGARFYTNAAPFLLALPAFGLGGLLPQKWRLDLEPDRFVDKGIQISGTLLAASILLGPLFFRAFKDQINIPLPACDPQDEIPFVIQVDPDSYVDILPGRAGQLSMVPQVRLDDFKANGIEPWDDLYTSLVSIASSTGEATRLLVAEDLIHQDFHFFAGEVQLFHGSPPDRIISGCAAELKTQYQSIYRIRRVVDPVPSTFDD